MNKHEKWLMVSMWILLIALLVPAADAEDPIRDGLVFWLDASKTEDLQLVGDQVERWNDRSGNSYYADQMDSALQPTYVAGALNGKGIVDFGDSVYGSLDQPWMQFRDASDAELNISNVRTVFWVAGMDAGSNGFLLGDDNNYHFHRGTEQQIWDGANGWAHANIRNGSTYLNGVEVDGTATVLPMDYSIISLVTAGNVETSTLTLDRTYRTGGIKLGELLIYDRALTDEERLGVEAYLYQKWMVPGAAFDPEPGEGAVDVLQDVTLSWTTGQFAVTHDVYFGTVFEDVNAASRTEPMDVLVSQGQDADTYEPGRLDLGQTYYWRIDEVNGAPDYAIYKGETWSFTVEPLAYPVENIVATSNGASQMGAEPVNTINGSGLDENDGHSVTSGDMWLASPPAEGNLYIQYEFDSVLKLHEMLVWNYNVQFEVMLGFGLKDVAIEYSEDGAEWTALGDFEFAQGTSAAGYMANTTVDFGGVAARYVRLTVNNSYGTMGSHGLSEVRFLYIPANAREPEPADGAVDVSVDTALTWRAGRGAASHEVYLSTDEAAVADGTALAGTVTEASYAAALDLDATYYWKVTEVNEAASPSAWAGSIWSFATEAFAVVDDFESYDDGDNPIFGTWIDGWTNGTGSTVGYLSEPFAEQTIVHGGGQSMPLTYDNASASDTSEADLALAPGQDWSRAGITTLTLYFRGAADNDAAQLFATINGTRVDYDGDTDALTKVVWTTWNIDLASLGINLTNVTTLTLGIEGSGFGTIYVDDIRLYRSPPPIATPVDPGTEGMLLEYTFDSDTSDSSGNGYDGTLLGDAYVADGVLVLDGTRDALSVPRIGGEGATFGQCTISMWAYPTEDLESLQFAGGMNTETWGTGAIHLKFNYGVINVGISGLSDTVGVTIAEPETWYHMAMTVSDTAVTVYLNGALEGSLALDAPMTDLILGAASIGAWNNGGATIEREMAGLIDNVRIYDRALSEGEVLFLSDM